MLTSQVAGNLPLTETEKKILDARLNGLALSQLDHNDALIDMHQLVLICCAISGAYLPNTEKFANVLAEQMLDFLLKFELSNLTIAEIVLAFQLNSKGTKYPSGNDVERIQCPGTFSVDFLGKVLEKYMDFRTILTRKFENDIDGY